MIKLKVIYVSLGFRIQKKRGLRNIIKYLLFAE